MHTLQVSPPVIKAVNFFPTEVPAPVSLKNECSSLKVLEATMRRHLRARKNEVRGGWTNNIFRVEIVDWNLPSEPCKGLACGQDDRDIPPVSKEQRFSTFQSCFECCMISSDFVCT